MHRITNSDADVQGTDSVEGLHEMIAVSDKYLELCNWEDRLKEKEEELLEWEQRLRIWSGELELGYTDSGYKDNHEWKEAMEDSLKSSLALIQSCSKSPSNTEIVTVSSHVPESVQYTSSYTTTSHAYDQYSTMSDLPGAGRCLGNFYSRSGRILEQAIGKFAHRCGYGPFAVGIRLSSLLYSMLGSFHVASWEAYVSGKFMERSVAPVVRQLHALAKYTEASTEITRVTASAVINDIVAVWGIATGTKLVNTLQILLESSNHLKTHEHGAAPPLFGLPRSSRESGRCFACMSSEGTVRAMREIEKEIGWNRGTQASNLYIISDLGQAANDLWQPWTGPLPEVESKALIPLDGVTVLDSKAIQSLLDKSRREDILTIIAHNVLSALYSIPCANHAHKELPRRRYLPFRRLSRRYTA